MELLERGPVVLVEMNSAGRFDRATAVIHVRAPPDALWRVATDFAHYKDFMPNLLTSTPTKANATQTDVEFEVEVPGINPTYTFRYTARPDVYEMTGAWQKGDLEGSFVKWRLRHIGVRGTLLYYTTASRNFSALVQALDDDQQTVTIGVNVSAALAVVKAIKRRTENR